MIVFDFDDYDAVAEAAELEDREASLASLWAADGEHGLTPAERNPSMLR
jgi:hypothetical protein